MEKKTSYTMSREERLKITVLHEIGHYLLMKRYNKLFPEHHIFAYRIKIYPDPFDLKNGEVAYLFSTLDLNLMSNEELEALLAIDLAGYVAPTVFFNISYFNLEEQSDYKSAYEISEILSERFNKRKKNRKHRITKSPEQIIKENEIIVKQYLEENKENLRDIAKILLDRGLLMSSDLKEIDEKYGL